MPASKGLLAWMVKGVCTNMSGMWSRNRCVYILFACVRHCSFVTSGLLMSPCAFRQGERVSPEMGSGYA